MRHPTSMSRVRWLAGIVLVLTLTLLSGTTSFSKQPPAKYALGDIPLDAATYQKYLKVWPAEMAEALPASYDARSEGIVTPAKDQGNCGSCWAFASVGAMESHMLKAFEVGPEDLSEQQQVSCNTDMYGCSGGSSTAIRYWEPKGPLYEACFAYTASDSTACIEDECQQLGYRVVDYHTVGVNDFKNSLYTYGPSYWRFYVYSDFFTYWNQGAPGEVYVNSGGPLEGGHAVLLIGWDDAKGAYLCKNSWGANDGPNGDGTFWIAYSGHARNLGFGMVNFGLTSVGCSSDAECSDGVYCNGAEACVAGTCQQGIPPSCPDDGLFCNGSEVCEELTQGCGHTGDPCGGGTVCVEETDTCAPLTCGNGTCDEGEDCTSCPDDCISGTGGSPEACWKYDGACHPVKEGPECADCAPTYCCGDGYCEGGEDVANCLVDCGCSDATDCDDNEPCTTDACEITGCTHTWAPCGLSDGCCGPDCTVDSDPDCASQCIVTDTCNCNGKCGRKESNTTCPWDCP